MSFQIDELAEAIDNKITLLHRFIDILKSQKNHRNHIWMKRAASIGNDIEVFVKDIDYVEKYGPKHTPTFGGSTADERRRAQNVMGYQLNKD